MASRLVRPYGRLRSLPLGLRRNVHEQKMVFRGGRATRPQVGLYPPAQHSFNHALTIANWQLTNLAVLAGFLKFVLRVWFPHLKSEKSVWPSWCR